MDRVTENLVEDYISSFNITEAEDMSDKFELFSIYSIVSKEYSDSFDVMQLWTGKENDTGIDGVAIMVNGRIIENKEEIDDLLEMNKYLDVTFIFIQSKTSSSFEAKEISNFTYGVSDFFEDHPRLPRNEEIRDKAEVMNYLYSKSAAMTKGLPLCKLFFITTGIWNDDRNLRARIESGKQDLLQKNLFADVVITPVDSRGIQKYYQSTKSAVRKEILFSNKSTLSDIQGVKEAYIGTLEFDQFIKLIDDEGKILNSVFYDNVRAFQGDNPVNNDIRKTIQDGKFDQFPILNNGVTVVAKSITPAANRFTLDDYQIVNGCQTSHVLYYMKDTPGIEKMSIPIRLIVSKDEDIVNDIIRATNNQTQVKPEELEALSDFQKSLEAYYATTKDDMQLYYERRSKQFNNNPLIIKTRIITIPIQIKAFAAMFLEEPHLVSRFYGRIIKNLGQRIFSKDHKQIVYYTSAFAYYRVDQLFRSHNLDAKYKKCKYHLLMLLPRLIMDDPRPGFNARGIEEYCDGILKELENTTKSQLIFNKAAETIQNSGVDINDRDIFKLQSTNKKLLDYLNTNRDSKQCK